MTSFRTKTKCKQPLLMLPTSSNQQDKKKKKDSKYKLDRKRPGEQRLGNAVTKKHGIVVGEVGKYQILKFTMQAKKKCVQVKHLQHRRSSRRLQKKHKQEARYELNEGRRIEEMLPKLINMMQLRRREWIGEQLRQSFPSVQYAYLEVQNKAMVPTNMTVRSKKSATSDPSSTTQPSCSLFDGIGIQYKDVLCFPPKDVVVPFAYHSLLALPSCWTNSPPVEEWSLYDSIESFKAKMMEASGGCSSSTTSKDTTQRFEFYVAREISINHHQHREAVSPVHSVSSGDTSDSLFSLTRRQSSLSFEDTKILPPLSPTAPSTDKDNNCREDYATAASSSTGNNQYLLPSLSIEFLQKLSAYGQESGDVKLRLLNEAKQDAKIYFEQEKFRVLSCVPNAVRERFNSIGFAKWTKSGKHLPVLILNPYSVPPGEARCTWLQKFQLRKDQGNVHKCELVVYWYGEDASTSMSKFSIVGQHQVLSWAEGSAKKYNIIPDALKQRWEREKALVERRKRRRCCRTDGDNTDAGLSLLTKQEYATIKAHEGMAKDLDCAVLSNRPRNWIQSFHEHHDNLCDHDLCAYYTALSTPAADK